MLRALAVIVVMLEALAAGAVPVGVMSELTPSERTSARLAATVRVQRAQAAFGLTAPQRNDVLNVVRASAKDYAASTDVCLTQEPRLLAALQKVHEEIRRSGHASDVAWRNVRAAQAPIVKREADYVTATNARAQAIWSILDTRQRLALRRPQGSREADWRLFRPLMLNPAQAAPSIGPTLQRFYQQMGLRDDELTRAIAYGRPIVEEWISLPSQLARTRADVYLGRLVSLPGSDVITRDATPRDLSAITTAFLAPESLAALDPSERPVSVYWPSDELWHTAEDVDTLLVAAVLTLSPDQVARVSALSRSVRSDGIALRRTLADIGYREEASLRVMVASVTNGRPVDAAASAQARTMETQRAVAESKAAKLRSTALASLRGILSSAQQQALAVATRRMISLPTVGVSEIPVRSSRFRQAARLLDGVRAQPAARQARLVDRLSQVAGNRQLAAAVSARATVLSAPDYTLMREDLVCDLLGASEPVDARWMEWGAVAFLANVDVASILQDYRGNPIR